MGTNSVKFSFSSVLWFSLSDQNHDALTIHMIRHSTSFRLIHVKNKYIVLGYIRQYIICM